MIPFVKTQALGNDFILVEHTTNILPDYPELARRICDLLAKDAEEPILSVSVGVASCPREADSVGTLLYAADRALYAMKDKRQRAARVSHV